MGVVRLANTRALCTVANDGLHSINSIRGECERYSDIAPSNMYSFLRRNHWSTTYILRAETNMHTICGGLDAIDVVVVVNHVNYLRISICNLRSHSHLVSPRMRAKNTVWVNTDIVFLSNAPDNWGNM